MIQTQKRTPRLVLGATCLIALATASPLFAQATPAPAVEAATTTQEETITLDPFTVSAQDQDGGYAVKDALGGNRVRTDLKDIGSALSVYNQQFLTDTGAVNNETLLKYTTNAEVGGVGGNFSGVGAVREPSESGSLLRPNANTRVRGLSAADNTRDFFLTEIPWDGYNIGRVDITRGANAILFGMGKPAGIINNSTNDANFKDENKFEARFDSYNGFRTSLDVNKVILRKELAARVSALRDHGRYRQAGTYNRDERVYGTANYTPSFLKTASMTTNLKVRYENGDIKSNRPRSVTPIDQITPWFTAMNKAVLEPGAAWNGVDGGDDMTRFMRTNDKGGGKNPSYNPWLADFGGIAGSAVSVFGDPSSSYQYFVRTYETQNYWGIKNTPNFERDGTIEGLDFARPVGIASYSNWANNVGNTSGGQGGPYKVIGGYKDNTISDAGLFDFWNNLLDGPNKQEWRGFNAFNATLSQSFFNDRLALQAAYDDQRYRDGQFKGLRNTLYVDINTRTLDGAANPNVGRALVRSDNGGSTYETKATVYRGTVTGELRSSDFFDNKTFNSIVGRHVFTGMYANETKDTKSLDFTRYSLDENFARFVKGTTATDLKIDSGTRSMPVLSYISGDLRTVSSPSLANLSQLSVTQAPNLSNGVYLYDSHWAKPTDTAAAGYVNPAAYWRNPRTKDAENALLNSQAENPANFRGWSVTPAKMLSYENGDNTYTKGIKTWRNVKSQSAIWQGHLFEDTVVPTVGWRRDEYRGNNKQIQINDTMPSIDPNDSKWAVSHDQPLVAGESLSYSVVLKSPRFINQQLPAGTNLSLFYNFSKNFVPSPGEKDMFNNNLANPEGETKDYGFVVSTLNDKLNFKFNWYTTKVANDRLQGFEFWRIPGLFSTWLAAGTRVNQKDPGATWKWDYSSWTNNGGQANADKGAAEIQNFYKTNEVFKGFVDGWNMTQFLTNEGSLWSVPAGVTATADSESKGIEFEVSAQPLKGWNVTANASKTTATQQNIGGALKTWIDTMGPLFAGPAGDLRQWWAGDSNNFRMLWNAEIQSQFNRLKAMEGTNVPELRPYRFNLVNTYTIQTGKFKGLSIGGAYRWEDRVIIGNATKMVRDEVTKTDSMVYDIDAPFYGPTENHIDMWTGYTIKLTKKVDWRIQLNIRDLFAKKRLVPISVQPDGKPGAYRIPDLTSWQLTNTFSF